MLINIAFPHQRSVSEDLRSTTTIAAKIITRISDRRCALLFTDKADLGDSDRV